MTRWTLAACLVFLAAAPASAQNPPGETATPTRPRYAILETVYFKSNSAALTDSARAALSAIVAILKVNPEAVIIVAGHSDERGSYGYNRRLAWRRAEAVTTFLKQGAPNTFETLQAGELQPADPGHTESAWARNRRVEFRVKNNTPLRLPPPPAR